MYKSVFYIIFSALFFISCEQKTDVEFETEKFNLLIVEALITNEYKSHEIILSKPVLELNQIPEFVSDAEVSVYINATKVNFAEDSILKGHYFADSMFIAVVDKYYSLEIKNDNKVFTAGTTIVPVMQPDTLKYQVNENTGLYSFDFSNSIVSDFESAMYELNLDWSHILGDSVNRAKLYFYTFKTLDVCEIFAPEQQKIYFPKGTKIQLRKYSLNEAHSAFLRGVLIETQWSGGYFDEANANPKTNLSSGATGFFGVSSVVERNFVVE